MFGLFKKPEWRSMDTAPRDGTKIRLKIHYGLEPSEHVAYWFRDGHRGPVWRLESEGPSNFIMYVNDINVPRSMGAGLNCLQWRPL